MKTIGHAHLIGALVSSLAAWSAGAADDLPAGAVRITADELKWRSGRVPGHEIAPMIGDSRQLGP